MLGSAISYGLIACGAETTDVIGIWLKLLELREEMGYKWLQSTKSQTKYDLMMVTPHNL